MRKITSFKTAFLAVIMMVAFANASAQTQVANIAALRAAVGVTASGTKGTTVYQITGEVVITLQSGTTSKTYFVQDATGAIEIYDAAPAKLTTVYNTKDGIKNLTGTITNYATTLEVIPTADAGVATSTGNNINPVEITYDQMSNNESKLVTIKNVVITGATGVFSRKGFPFTVNGLGQSASSPTIYPFADLDYIGQNVPTTAQDVTGIVLPYNANMELIPRNLADFKPHVGTSFTAPNADLLTVSRSGNTLTVNNVANGSTVEIYSAVGAKVQTAQLVNSTVQLNNLSKGLYVVRVGNQSSKIMM